MISVILVTYNSVSVLPDCIRSLENSSCANDLEVVVADNCSIDGTVDWLDKYKEDTNSSFAGFTTLRLRTNRGYAYANNRALEYSHGETVLLLNPDTVVEPHAIEDCARVLERDSNVGAVGCRLVLPDGTLDRACKRSFPTLWNSFARLSGLSFVFPGSRLFAGYNLSYLDENKSYPVDSICGAFMMVPNTVFNEVGCLDEDYFMYGEDIDYCYRIKQAGFEILYQGTVSTLHLKGGNGGKRSRKSLKHFYEAMYLYYRKTRKDKRAPMAFLLRVTLGAMWMVHIVVMKLARTIYLRKV